MLTYRLNALQHGELDMVISNVTMNPKRNMHVAFVGRYLTSESVSSPNTKILYVPGRGAISMFWKPG